MKREEFYKSIEEAALNEKYFRALIRKTISEYEFKAKKSIVAEKLLRAKIQKIISEKKETMQYDSTGLNTLDDMFMNTNFLKTIQTAFASLTTSDEQKKDYKNHIINSIINILAQADVDGPREMKESIGRLYKKHMLQQLFEEEEPDLSIEVSDEELPDDKIVGPEARKEDEEEAEPDEDPEKAVDPEKDMTGQVKANSVIPKIEKSILDYYGSLGNPGDRKDFRTYIIANLEMYFKTWADAGENEVTPPTSPDVQQAVSDAEAKLDAGGEPAGDEEGGEEAADEGGEELDLGI